MVKRILRALNKEISGLHQAAYLLGFFAICSQLLALVRDRILAGQFGAGHSVDLYYTAFRIPDVIFVTVASIVSVSVIIPYLSKKLEEGPEEARLFLDTLFSFFIILITVSAGIAFALAPWILREFFPNFVKAGSFGELLRLTRIILLSPIFLGLSNLFASVTQSKKRFFTYALSPVVYNLGIIFGIIFFYPIFGLSGLGLGVVLGAFLHFFIQVPFVISEGLFPRFQWPLRFELIKKIVWTSIPRTITVSSNELAEMILISFASSLMAGSVAVFNYSFNLQSVPFSIIGISYSLAAFPVLIKLYSSGDMEKFVDQMITSSKHIIFWSLPITVLFVVLRAQIVRTLLGAGNFDWNDTRLTAASLAIFTTSLLAQNLMNIFVRAFYSRGKTLVPLIMNIISAGFIIVVSFVLVRLFSTYQIFRYFFESLLKVSDISGTTVLMLPLGFSLGVILNAIIHWIGFQKEFPRYSRPVLKTLFQVASSSIIMGYVAHLGLDIFDNVFNLNTLVGIFMQGFLAGVMGIVSAIIVLILLRSEELAEVWGTLHKKIWRTNIVGPDVSME